MANKITRMIGMIFLVVILAPLAVSFASANNCTALYADGDSAYRADIVIVGHGWAEGELNDFYNNVKYISDYLLTLEPYSDYSDMINIWYINQSADLNCSWSGSICNISLVTALASQCSSYDKVYVLMNDTGFGGAGNPSMAFGTINPDYKEEIFAHEMGGHSFGELMDEYVYSSPSTGDLYFSGANCALPEEANYQAETISCDKWSNVSETGCFSGCSYSNLYRPTFNSMMNNLAGYFNGPSQNQIEKMIDKFTNLTIDYNPKTAAAMVENDTQEFNITKANEADEFTIKWFVNGNEKTSAENQTSFIYTCRDTNPEIKVKASYLGISENYAWNVESNVTNVAPNIISYNPSENASIDEDSFLEFNISVEDYNEDYLNYSWLLDGTENSTNQTWTYNTDFSSAGNYNVTLIVSDGELTDSQEWNITVNNVNRKPVITKFNDLIAYEGDIITLNPTITDADNESLTVTYSGWMDSATKATNYSDAGNYSVIVNAFDGIDNSTKEITITVLNSYEFRTAIKDRDTKERLVGTVSINGTEKAVVADSATIFDYVHSDAEYNIIYSSLGYQTDNYPIYFDNRIPDCTIGADCLLEGTITSDCKWDQEHWGWLCRLTKEGWQYASYFDYDINDNAIKRIDYMIK